VLLSVVVLLPAPGAPLFVVVVVESVDFCVTSGDGAGAPGDALVAGEGAVSSVVLVVVVSFVVPRHPTITVPAMKANPATAANERILFEIFMGLSISKFINFASATTGSARRPQFRISRRRGRDLLAE
jgi:hypothetical protein